MTLRDYLHKEKLNGVQFAKLIGVYPQQIYRYISGERNPSRETMIKIAEKTRGDVKPADWFTENDSGFPKRVVTSK